ncbi:MAG: hypothetical protein ACXWHG_13735, partial [Thermoanaerobaculia bacterium]
RRDRRAAGTSICAGMPRQYRGSAAMRPDQLIDDSDALSRLAGIARSHRAINPIPTISLLDIVSTMPSSRWSVLIVPANRAGTGLSPADA